MIVPKTQLLVGIRSLNPANELTTVISFNYRTIVEKHTHPYVGVQLVRVRQSVNSRHIYHICQ
jgi:hypothetical protein